MLISEMVLPCVVMICFINEIYCYSEEMSFKTQRLMSVREMPYRLLMMIIIMHPLNGQMTDDEKDESMEVTMKLMKEKNVSKIALSARNRNSKKS